MYTHRQRITAVIILVSHTLMSFQNNPTHEVGNQAELTRTVSSTQQEQGHAVAPAPIESAIISCSYATRLATYHQALTKLHIPRWAGRIASYQVPIQARIPKPSDTWPAQLTHGHFASMASSSQHTLSLQQHARISELIKLYDYVTFIASLPVKKQHTALKTTDFVGHTTWPQLNRHLSENELREGGVYIGGMQRGFGEQAAEKNRFYLTGGWHEIFLREVQAVNQAMYKDIRQASEKYRDIMYRLYIYKDTSAPCPGEKCDQEADTRLQKQVFIWLRNIPTLNLINIEYSDLPLWQPIIGSYQAQIDVIVAYKTQIKPVKNIRELVKELTKEFLPRTSHDLIGW